ncbi:hypothetical protein LPJ79_002750 [Coemansia sp. RSA 1821]|nr:hypothetical protein LPJ68_002227 [Coemansia sp. RSA 1086]KAJ1750645.1 hypothetical protein LPJ79_002750 [Coemansia sp. RSA 1821]
MPAVKTLEERGRVLTDALFAQDVLAYRGAVDTGAMLDTLLAMHEELNDRPFLSSPNICEFVARYKSTVESVKALRLSKHDFDFIRTLARGQFGIVDIVRSKHNRGVYAMKTLNKQALLSQREQAAFLEERDVLVLGRDSPWIPDLYAAFQDKDNLYIVMEFVAGGDLFSMLDRCENAVVDESAARFYAAELVLALEDLHKIGYIHRDCKPQNTLLDERGHVKLADFGSCARIDAAGAHEAKTSVPVGTCDYIAPETLRAREMGSSAAVSTSCDWWSLGAVLYEMLYGDPPFYSDSVPETYAKIMACEKNLTFDEDAAVSAQAKDLMKRLLVRQEDRLTLEGIKAHPFFAGVDWATLRAQEAPFVPRISSPDDTSNFSVGEEAEEDIGMAVARASSSRLGHGREYAGEQLPFIGFTYQPPALALAAKRAAPSTPRGPRDDPSQVRVLRLRAEQAEAAVASAEARWAARQAKWDDERQMLEDKVAALEAQAMQPPRAATPLPARTRDSAVCAGREVADRSVETEGAADRAAAPEAKSEPLPEPGQSGILHKDSAVADACRGLVKQVASTLEAQLGAQAEHLETLTAAVNTLAAAAGTRVDDGLQAQKRELAQLSQLVQAALSAPMPQSGAAATAAGSPSPAANGSPRLSSVASLSQAHQASGSHARLSIGSTQTTRSGRRSISAVEDGTALDSHPKSVVATLVNEMSRNASGAGSISRVARAERRVSTGVASDALSVIGNKCDRLAALLEQQTAEIGAVQQAQSSLLAMCSELKLAAAAAAASHDPPAAPHEASGGADTQRRSRRKTEQLRRRAADPFGSVASRESASNENARALELLKAATDDIIAGLRVQLTEAESARAAAETRATELLEWIGRESKGRALLEDMIRTAQQACRLAETRLDSMTKEREQLQASLAAKENELSSAQAAVETREKELRHLRRASRKAMDQLADLKGAQHGDADASERTRDALDEEIKEAAAVHVRLQFEIARLEGEVSRLESEKSQLAKDVAHRDKRLRDMEARLRQANDAADGIRVRGVDGDDDRFGSGSGTKSHKRYKIQLQNMQKHIEYLETKLALATSENDMLKKQQPSGNGIRFPGFSRTTSTNGTADAQHGSSKPKARPASTMFPNLHSNMEAFASTISLNSAQQQQQRPDSSEHADGNNSNSSIASSTSRRRVPTEPHVRPRNDSLTSSFERIRSPFKGFRKHFT